ncbi:MAG: hypothetical protein WBD99_03965 [Thermodesulfobacteriota bacterium]
MNASSNTHAQVRLVHNATDTTHLDAVRRILVEASDIAVCVAYLKMSGLRLLDEVFRKVMANGARLILFIGTDQYLTEPTALRALLRRIGRQENGEAFLVKRLGATFHPKLYFAGTKNSAVAIIGSANITGGGLEKNIEASVQTAVTGDSPFCRQLESFIESLRTGEATERLDPIAISQYEARYEIFRNHRQKADRTAKKEIGNLPEANDRQLKQYLRRYLTDLEQNDRRKARARDYAKARNVLDRIAALSKPTKAEFMGLYEPLVGVSRGEKLWHSGSVFRSKNTVASKYHRVISLVRSLKSRIGKPPLDVYDTALKHSANIPGLGPNVITEILNTYDPTRYAVLNKNPIESLKKLGFKRYPSPSSFSADTYAEYCEFLTALRKRCRLRDLNELDGFLNFIYWHTYGKK